MHEKKNISFCSCSDLTLSLLSYCCLSSYTYRRGFDPWDLSIWRSCNAADWISFFSEHCASNDMQLGPRRGEIWQKWGSKRHPIKWHAAIIRRVTRANGVEAFTSIREGLQWSHRCVTVWSIMDMVLNLQSSILPLPSVSQMHRAPRCY